MSITLLEALSVAESSKHTSDVRFLHYLESHVEFIKRDPSLVVLELEPSATYHALEDAYTFQQRMRIPAKHWWINLRLNDLCHPNDLLGDTRVFYSISHSMYNSLYSAYVSAERRI